MAAPPAFDWTASENALHAWLTAATGLAVGKIMWANQDVPEPAAPFLTLKIIAFAAIPGMPAIVQTYDAAAVVGEELTLASDDRHHLTIGVQAFSADHTGAASAWALLSRAKAALSLPAVRAGLTAARLASFDASGITDLSALRETRWQSRATMQVRFHAVDSASSKSTWIETIEFSGEALAADGVIATGPSYSAAAEAAVLVAQGLRFANSVELIGTVDGTNAAFTLPHTPSPAASLLLVVNGVVQFVGLNFTLSGAAVTFLAGSIPQVGELGIRAWFQYVGDA